MSHQAITRPCFKAVDALQQFPCAPSALEPRKALKLSEIDDVVKIFIREGYQIAM
jgi:hypothetical protein